MPQGQDYPLAQAEHQGQDASFRRTLAAESHQIPAQSFQFEVAAVLRSADNGARHAKNKSERAIAPQIAIHSHRSRPCRCVPHSWRNVVGHTRRQPRRDFSTCGSTWSCRVLPRFVAHPPRRVEVNNLSGKHLRSHPALELTSRGLASCRCRPLSSKLSPQ